MLRNHYIVCKWKIVAGKWVNEFWDKRKAEWTVCSFVCVLSLSLSMYVYISMVLCSVSCFTLLFITMIVISHRLNCDCVYSFFFKFHFIVNLVNIRIHIDYVCVYLTLSSFRIFCFCLPFFSTYLYTVLDYVWVCNFTCLHLTFSVLFNYMLSGDKCSV